MFPVQRDAHSYFARVLQVQIHGVGLALLGLVWDRLHFAVKVGRTHVEQITSPPYAWVKDDMYFDNSVVPQSGGFLFFCSIANHLSIKVNHHKSNPASNNAQCRITAHEHERQKL